jgi:uncharacterized protein YjbJ (UPF0337 family)
MNSTEFTGNWNETKVKLKQKFALLIENDLLFLAGRKEEMMTRIQLKLGKTRAELEAIIAAL